MSLKISFLRKLIATLPSLHPNRLRSPLQIKRILVLLRATEFRDWRYWLQLLQVMVSVLVISLFHLQACCKNQQECYRCCVLFRIADVKCVGCRRRERDQGTSGGVIDLVALCIVSHCRRSAALDSQFHAAN